MQTSQTKWKNRGPKLRQTLREDKDSEIGPRGHHNMFLCEDVQALTIVQRIVILPVSNSFETSRRARTSEFVSDQHFRQDFHTCRDFKSVQLGIESGVNYGFVQRCVETSTLVRSIHNKSELTRMPRPNWTSFSKPRKIWEYFSIMLLLTVS